MSVGYPNLPCPNCGGDCETTGIPCVQSNPCLKTWDRRSSEGCRVYLAPYDGTLTPPLTDAEMTDVDAWMSLIDNETKEAPYIRCFTAVGDLPLPTKNTFEYKSEEIVIDKTYQYNWDIIDVNPVNFDFLREISCGLNAWFAWATDGGSLFGWSLATIDGDVELLRGANSLETFKFTSTWTEKCVIPRYDDPFQA